MSSQKSRNAIRFPATANHEDYVKISQTIKGYSLDDEGHKFPKKLSRQLPEMTDLRS